MKSPWAPSGSDACDHRFLALQPIFNRQRKIFGYEALSRSGWDNQFTGDSDTATKMMVGDWIFYGLDQLTGGRRTFLNCTREALVRGLLTLLPPSTVLELLETVEPDKEVLAACRRMKALGYQIALDDFQHCERMEGLIALADYVKVDYRLSCKEERREIIRRLKRNAATLVAEKIETNDEFEMALEEGFRLFQGYYLGRPKVFSKCELPINDVNHIHRLDLYARSKALLAEERGISALSAVGSNGSTYWTD
jgi:c-di-GMP-related signal transduction protein